MMNTPFSSTGQLARYFVAGPLVLALALGFSGARAQGAGPAVPAASRNGASAGAIDKKKDAVALDTHTESPAALSPATHPLPDGIKAYIAQTYPHAKLVAWASSDTPLSKAPFVKYLATLQEGKQHTDLFFNEAGHPVRLAKPTAHPREVASATDVVVPRAAAAGHRQPVPSQVYLDGQLYKGSLADLGGDNIASINVIKGEQARRLFGAVADTGDGVVVVTTKANQDTPEVRAFNDKLGIAAPTAPAAKAAPAASVAYLAAPALAYITQHYEAARLLGVREIKAADGGPSRYQAEIVIGRRPGYLLFDGAGQFISESYTR